PCPPTRTCSCPAAPCERRRSCLSPLSGRARLRLVLVWPRRQTPRSTLQRLQAEQRAFDSRWTDRDTEILKDVIAVDRFDLVERLALDLFGEDRSGRLRDRAALAVEAHVRDAVVLDAQGHAQLVAAQRVRVGVRVRRAFELPVIARVLVVIEDVVAVHVVHRYTLNTFLALSIAPRRASHSSVVL